MSIDWTIQLRVQLSIDCPFDWAVEWTIDWTNDSANPIPRHGRNSALRDGREPLLRSVGCAIALARCRLDSYTERVSVVENLARLEEQIAAACARVARPRSDVLLVAVTKTRTPEEVTEAIRCGVRAVGENRVQEAAAKKPLVSLPCPWHLVGSLQTNKARRALELFDTVQSIDSSHLAEEIQRRCAVLDRRVAGYLEVNTSAEESKHGVAPDELPALIEAVLACDRIDLSGLMTIGPGWAIEDPEASRPCFALLRRLAEENRKRFGVALAGLSMGMSSDFAVGIEEGATIVRVGTAIFGPRPA